MRTLSVQDYESLIDGGTLVEKDANGGRVFFLGDGSVFKLFSHKPFLSSETLRPYAVRFARNAQKLRERNVWTVNVLDVLKVKHLHVLAVHYDPIPGDTLRSVANADEDLATIVTDFAKFVANLHDQGIYFRSMHLANVIVGNNRQMGLIDIADLWMKRRPLNFKERFRNIGKIYRYTKDIELLRQPGESVFVDAYLAATTARDSAHWKVPLQEQQLARLQEKRR